MLSSMQKQYDHRDWRGPDEPRVLRKIAGIKAADEGLEVKGSSMALTRSSRSATVLMPPPLRA